MAQHHYSMSSQDTTAHQLQEDEQRQSVAAWDNLASSLEFSGSVMWSNDTVGHNESGTDVNETLSSVLMTFVAVALSFVVVLAIFFNGLLCLVFQKRPVLINVSNSFVLNLSVCQLGKYRFKCSTNGGKAMSFGCFLKFWHRSLASSVLLAKILCSESPTSSVPLNTQFLY